MNQLSRLAVACLATLSAAACSNPKVYTVKVTGEGFDYYDSSKVLIFQREHSDIRFDTPVTQGYIERGRFSLSFQDSTANAYAMIIEDDVYDDNAFMTYSFFSDRVPLHFTASRSGYGTDYVDVKGSKDNEELYLYMQGSWDANNLTDSLLYELDRWLVSKYGDELPQEGSEDYAIYYAKADSIMKIYRRQYAGYEKWRSERLRSHKSLAGLLEVTDDIRYAIDRIINTDSQAQLDSALVSLYMEYREIYPDNSMIRQVEELMQTVDRLRPGMPYPDFKAPCTDGNSYSLSELVTGKIAVLDCWASWCGGCRANSIRMKPLYDKYKDRGFTIVGVAREFKDLKAMEHAVKNDGYTWTQLYDLDDREGIWNLYGIHNNGGGIFLIGKDGRIVEKVQDISSVESYLKEHLGE